MWRQENFIQGSVAKLLARVLAPVIDPPSETEALTIARGQYEIQGMNAITCYPALIMLQMKSRMLGAYNSCIGP